MPPPVPSAPLPPPAAPVAPQPAPYDPHAIGAAAARLSGSTKKSSRVVLGILSVLLEPGELVECLVGGKVHDLDGLLVLTDRRLLVLNDRPFQPDQLTIPVDQAVSVRGEATGNTATITVQREQSYAQLTRVSDVQLAQEFAQRIRGRAATSG
jgi:hypothetical protein